MVEIIGLKERKKSLFLYQASFFQTYLLHVYLCCILHKKARGHFSTGIEIKQINVKRMFVVGIYTSNFPLNIWLYISHKCSKLHLREIADE